MFNFVCERLFGSIFSSSFWCEKRLLTSCDTSVVSGLHTGHFDLKSLTPPLSPLLLQEFHGRP